MADALTPLTGWLFWLIVIVLVPIISGLVARKLGHPFTFGMLIGIGLLGLLVVLRGILFPS